MTVTLMYQRVPSLEQLLFRSCWQSLLRSTTNSKPQVRIHALKSGIFCLKLFNTGQLTHAESAILGFPVVEGRISDAVLPTDVSDLQSLHLFVEDRDDLVLIIHPYPSEEMFKGDLFICSDPLKIVFKNVVFEKDSMSGITDDGEQLKLFQINEKQFSKIKETYRKHLKVLSEVDVIASFSYWNSISSGQVSISV